MNEWEVVEPDLAGSTASSSSKSQWCYLIQSISCFPITLLEILVF